jgi:hypothetical protein
MDAIYYTKNIRTKIKAGCEKSMSLESGRHIKAPCGAKYWESDGSPDCAVCQSRDCELSPQYEDEQKENETKLAD